MRYARLLSKLYCEPIMMLPTVWATFSEALQNHIRTSADIRTGGETAGPQSKIQSSQRRSDRAARIYEQLGSVAIIHLDGVIDKHVSMAHLDCYGGVDLDDVDQVLARAEADPTIKTIVLNINSPGGSALGTPETAARVSALAKQKDVLAYSDSQCCSAAYYIGAQASELYISGSAWIGSIGTYIALLDATESMAKQGLRVNLIKEGEYKAMGAPWKELTDPERAIFQAQVKQINDEFISAVGKGRPGADRAAMEGQCFIGSEAVKAGLADGIVNSLDEVVASLI